MTPFFKHFSRWERLKRIIRAVDISTLLFSLAIGASIWFYVNARRTTSREISVPIKIELPVGWELQGDPPRERVVVVYGTQQLVQTFSTGDLVFKIRVSALDDGAVGKTVDLRLTGDNLSGMPSDLEVTVIRDPNITVQLVKQVRRYLPVELTLTGSLPPGSVMRGYQLSPQYIPVTAPEKSFASGQVVKTRPLDLSGRKKSFVDYVDLVPLELNDRTVILSNSVFVQFSVSDALVQRTLTNVPVEILSPSAGRAPTGKFSPVYVSVKVEGAEPVVNILSPAQLTVYIDSRELAGDEPRNVKVQAINNNNEVIKVLEITPPEILWTPSSAESAEQ